MLRIPIKATSGLVAGALTAAIAIALPAAATSKRPTATAAATKKLRVTSVSSGGSGTEFHGKITKSPWGKGTYTVSIKNLPNSSGKWKFKGGTIRTKGTAKLSGVRSTGKVKLYGGTGKFRGISGKATFVSPDITKPNYKTYFKGTYSP